MFKYLKLFNLWCQIKFDENFQILKNTFAPLTGKLSMDPPLKRISWSAENEAKNEDPSMAIRKNGFWV